MQFTLNSFSVLEVSELPRILSIIPCFLELFRHAGLYFSSFMFLLIRLKRLPEWMIFIIATLQNLHCSWCCRCCIQATFWSIFGMGDNCHYLQSCSRLQTMPITIKAIMLLGFLILDLQSSFLTNKVWWQIIDIFFVFSVTKLASLVTNLEASWIIIDAVEVIQHCLRLDHKHSHCRGRMQQ